MGTIKHLTPKMISFGWVSFFTAHGNNYLQVYIFGIVNLRKISMEICSEVYNGNYI